MSVTPLPIFTKEDNLCPEKREELQPVEASAELKKDLFHTMLRIRMVEERIADLYQEHEMRCPCHLCIGQEAVAAGACANLKKKDHLFGTYRGHGIYLAKGGSLKAMIAELYGKRTGCTRGKGGSMQLVAPDVGLVCTSALVGGTIPMAVGSALAARMQDNDDRVAVVVFGDGATEEGVFHESMNFASLKKLPVVFICENNFYAVYTHQSARQCADNIFERASAYRMPGERIDGNNVLDVYHATGAAIARARKGDGPSLIECQTYRWLEHVGPHSDTHLGYRSEEELRKWLARCPLKKFRELLLREGIMSEEDIRKITSQVAEEIEEAVTFAKSSPSPDASELAQGVYAP